MSAARVILLFFTSYQFVGAKNIQFQITPITKSFDIIGGPFFDPRSEKLYFTDVVNGKIFRYDLFSQKIENISFPEAAIVVPKQDDVNLLIVGAKRKVFEIRWNIEKDNYDSMKELNDISVGRDGGLNYGNETFLQGRADVNGYLWFGTTMGFPVNVQSTKRTAGLYQIYPKGVDKWGGDKWIEILSGLRISGEVAWNFENTRVYIVVPTQKQLIQLRYYPEEDAFDNPRIEDVAKNVSGYPIGLAVDTNGHVWISTCGEGYIYEFDPNKNIIVGSIKLPVKYITDITFGTSCYDRFYATTSRVSPFNGQPNDNHTAAGAVFAIKISGVKGFPLHYASNDFK